MDKKQELGMRIAQKRMERNLSRVDVAQKLGISPQAVYNWEKGKNSLSISNLNSLAILLGAPIEYFCEGSPSGENEFKQRWKLTDELFSIEQMEEKVKSFATNNKYDQTSSALTLMKYLHKDQIREGTDGLPHISHPLMMACHAIALGLFENDTAPPPKQDVLLSVILLHDVLDDCDTSITDLHDKLGFCEEVVDALNLLSDKQYNLLPRDDRKRKYFDMLAGNELAVIVKSLSYCNNVSTMATAFSKRKMASYIDDIEYYLLPLIDKIIISENNSDFDNSLFLVKYHILSVIESIKHILSRETENIN